MSIEKISLLRHGEKPGVNDGPEEIKLTVEQKQMWDDAIIEGEDPGIKMENVPKIEEMASEIFDSLPDKALVLFTATPRPRTRMTANLLSMSLINKSKDSGKNISVGFICDHPDESVRPSEIASEADGVIELWKKIAAEEALTDASLDEYLANPAGGMSHPREIEIFLKLVQQDLSSDNSKIRNRAEELKTQIQILKNKFADLDTPIFFYGIGHISTLVALEVAMGRTNFDSIEDIPKPLDLYEINPDNSIEKK